MSSEQPPRTPLSIGENGTRAQWPSRSSIKLLRKKIKRVVQLDKDDFTSCQMLLKALKDKGRLRAYDVKQGVCNCANGARIERVKGSQKYVPCESEHCVPLSITFMTGEAYQYLAAGDNGDFSYGLDAVHRVLKNKHHVFTLIARDPALDVNGFPIAHMISETGAASAISRLLTFVYENCPANCILHELMVDMDKSSLRAIIDLSRKCHDHWPLLPVLCLFHILQALRRKETSYRLSDADKKTGKCVADYAIMPSQPQLLLYVRFPSAPSLTALVPIAAPPPRHVTPVDKLFSKFIYSRTPNHAMGAAIALFTHTAGMPIGVKPRNKKKANPDDELHVELSDNDEDVGAALGGRLSRKKRRSNAADLDILPASSSSSSSSSVAMTSHTAVGNGSSSSDDVLPTLAGLVDLDVAGTACGSRKKRRSIVADMDILSLPASSSSSSSASHHAVGNRSSSHEILPILAALVDLDGSGNRATTTETDATMADVAQMNGNDTAALPAIHQSGALDGYIASTKRTLPHDGAMVDDDVCGKCGEPFGRTAIECASCKVCVVFTFAHSHALPLFLVCSDSHQLYYSAVCMVTALVSPGLSRWCV